MADSATDIVSVTQALRQLQEPNLPAGQTRDRLESELTDLISQCVSWIEERTGLPLITVRQRHLLDPPEDGGRLDFRVFNVSEINSFTYWQKDGTPITVTEPSDLPVYAFEGFNPVLWPPGGGAWPSGRANAPFVIDVVRSVSPIPPMVERLALELLTRLYDNQPLGMQGGTRVMLEACPREPARRLPPAQVLERGGVPTDLASNVLTLRGQPLTLRDGSFVTLRD